MSFLRLYPLVVVAFGVACSSTDTGQPGGPADDGSAPDAATQDGNVADVAAQQDGSNPVDGMADAGPPTLTVTHQFDGDYGPGLAACQAKGGHCDRPELNVAADGTHVVQVTWQNVNVYDYTGKLLSSTPLATFITNAGLSPTAQPYEPHVVYDEFIGRWLLTASCLNDCLVVSASADPLGSWQGVYLGGPQFDPGIHLGYDKNGAYFSEFRNGDTDSNTANYSYNDFAIPSAELKWTGTFAPTHRNQGHNTPLDGMPVIDHNPSKLPTDPAFFLAKNCTGGSCQNGTNFSFDWLVTTVTWSGTTATYGSDQLVKTDIGSAGSKWLYNTPRNGGAASQTGTTTQLRVMESHRVTDAVQVGSHVHGVLPSGPCNASCGAQGTDANDLVFWVDLDCTSPAACVVSQTAKIASATEDYVYPSVGVDSNGNVGITAAALSSAIAPSIYAWGHLATQAPNTLFGPTTVTAGTQSYTCAANPVSFGGAVGMETVRDPLDGTKLWTTQQYGSSGTACVWNTRIVEYQVW